MSSHTIPGCSRQSGAAVQIASQTCNFSAVFNVRLSRNSFRSPTGGFSLLFRSGEGWRASGSRGKDSLIEKDSRLGSRLRMATYDWKLIGVLGLSALLAGCSGDKTAAASSGKGPGGRGDAPTPVIVAKAVQKNVPVQAEVIGSVEPFSTVSLKSQISGQLMEAKFRDGDFVNQGQLLMTIDSRAIEAQIKQLEATIKSNEAALLQAQANLSRDKAQEENARAMAQRSGQLWKEGIVSKEQYQQLDSTAAGSAAVLKADEAAIENARAQIAASRAALETQRIQLSYTKIYAPNSGRTGTISTKPGNIVTANTTELATINQLQPVYVTFSLPESYLA